MNIRKLEWSENVNVNRNVSLGGVSSGPNALGNNVDLDSIATMFDDIITQTAVTNLDIGDGRLMRTQQMTRNLMSLGQSHTGAVHGIPLPLDGIVIVTINE